VRIYEVATAAAIIGLAAIAMVDSARKAGWTSTGPDTGFYPFWSAAAMAVAGAVVLVQALRRPSASGGIFGSAEGAKAFLSLVVPMTVATGLIAYLGLYIVSGAYMAFFALAIGRYRWIYAVALALALPVALYFGFERAFRFALPKSALYPLGILPV
jgi:hypothetical protein